jgi:hypothetical protein
MSNGSQDKNTIYRSWFSGSPNMLHWRWVKRVSALNDEGREFQFTAELRELLVAQKAKADALKEYGIIALGFFTEKASRS